MSLLTPSGLLTRIREEEEGFKYALALPFSAEEKAVLTLACASWMQLESDIEAELLAAKENGSGA